MTPSLCGFADELMIIKTATAEEERKFRREFAKEFLKNVGYGGAGFGVGVGGAYTVGELFRRMGRQFSPDQAKNVRRIAGALSAAGTMAALSAFSTARGKTEDVRRRHQR